MLAVIKLLLIIALMALGMGIIFKQRIEKTIPVSVMLIVLLMYVSGYMGNLKIGFISVLVVTGLIVIYAVKLVISDKHIIKSVLSPYAAYYLVFAAWMYIRFSGKMLNEWDEFTHWGFSTKVMYDSDMFSNFAGSTIYFVDYLPGNALFQYFLLQLGGCYREDLMIIAQGLYIFAFMMPILGELKIGKKEIFSSIPIAFLMYVLPMGFYPTAYSSLYVDATLAVIFGYVLFQALREQEYDLFFYVKMSLGLGTLCITKPSGIGLLVIAAIIIFADNIAKGRYKGFIQGKSYIRLLLDIIPFVIGFIYKKAWAIRLDKLGYLAHFDTGKITVDGTIDILQGGGEAYQQQTLQNFIHRYIASNLTTYNLSALVWYVILFVVIVMATYMVSQNGAKRYITLGIVSSASFILYSFYMLLLYLFTYSPGEAVALASFDRYEYTIIMGIIIGLMGWLIHKMCNSDRVMCSGFIVVALLTVFVVPNNITISVMNDAEIEHSISMRSSYSFGEKIRDNLTDKDKVYIISQGSDGLDYFVLRYTLSPVHTQTRLDHQGWWEVSWNIGQENGQGLSRRVISDTEWINYLIEEKFDYVLLYKVDDQFRQEFGVLFDANPDNNQLYRVNSMEKTLEYVEIN